MLGLNWARIHCLSEQKLEETAEFYEQLGFKEIEYVGNARVIHLFESNPPITFLLEQYEKSESNFTVEIFCPMQSV